jgi:hypothetical protein
VYMFDIKTEVIVNGSWRASCDMCFQGIDEDTSSVRVLLLYCLWESTGARAYTPFDSRSLFRRSSARHRQLLYVAYLHAQTDLYYIFILLLFTPFFPVQLMTEKLSEILMCATIDRSYCSFFQVFIWQAMRQKEWERADIDYDQFPLSLYIYNRQGKKLLVSQKRKIDSWE